jgi:enamine deaminase RidA (YjgF/YER057c/UK114 family)
MTYDESGKTAEGAWDKSAPSPYSARRLCRSGAGGQAGNLLFLSGTLPVEGGVPQFLGRIGADLSIEDGRRATRLAALNALALAKEHLGSLDRVTRVVRLGVSLVTTPEFREHPKVADAASELLVSVFGSEKASTRLVFGVASLPVGVCVVLESIFEIGN